MTQTSSRIAWVLEDQDLTQRLNRMWPGEAWQSDDSEGLAVALDAIPAWAGWDSWDPDTQAGELGTLLDQWGQPADAGQAPAPQPEPLSQDTSQPRWNPGSGYWEVYNEDRQAWWPYDADSGTWFDPAAQQWIPDRPDSARPASPLAGGPFDWATAEQARSAAGLYGDDWADGLASVLDQQWGPGWQDHPAEHKQAWLTDLLPALAPPAPASRQELALEGKGIDFDDFEEIDLDDADLYSEEAGMDFGDYGDNTLQH